MMIDHLLSTDLLFSKNKAFKFLITTRICAMEQILQQIF